MRALALSLALAAAAAAQPLGFGSSDDVLELGSGVREGDRARVAAYGGPAYLPDAWRGAARLELDALSGRLSVGLGGTVHSGDGGLYGPEDDELYDLARVVRYVRLNSTAGARSYLRVGPTERVTLGSGALVRGYRTTGAWDERRIGAETAVEGRGTRLAVFASDILSADGVVGAEATVQTGVDVGPLRAVGLTVAAVHDLGQRGVTGDSSLTGVELKLRGTSGDGPTALRPFLTHARYLGQGSTVGAGVDLGSANLADAIRARGRVALFASTADFVPGHVGPFYALSNQTARIVDDGAFFDPARPEPVLAGTPLDSLAAGLDLVLDLRLVAFGRFEASQHFRRHIGDERASAFAVRLAGRLPGDARVEFALERQDFRGVLDLIQDLGALNTLVLDVRLPVGRLGQVYVRSRYGYRRLTADDGFSGEERYLVERRFQPMVGLRLGG